MTEQEKERMQDLYRQGYGYKKIAKEMGLNVGSVSIYFRRLREKKNATFCKSCGKKLKQTKGHRQKIFCDDNCRRYWWTHHRDEQQKNAWYEYDCKQCGNHFKVYGNKHRVYCSWECYLLAKSGGKKNE